MPRSAIFIIAVGAGRAPVWLIAAVIVALIIVVIGASIALQGAQRAPQAPAPQQEQPQPAPAKPAEEARPKEEKPAEVTAGIQYDEALAEKGLQFFQQACTACHSIQSLGVTGGAVGPDLSRVLLGNEGVPGSVIGRFFAENGLEDPAADPERAAELLKQFLINPPDYSPTMKAQVNAYKATYGDAWQNEYIPQLIELFKKAAAAAGG